MNDRLDPRPPPESARPVEPLTVELPAESVAKEPPTVDLRTQSTPHDPAARAASTGQATRQVGDYELLGEIQRGGMGVVYRARERHSGRLVALKMMLDETVYGDADLQRFVLEARATAELNHPGIVAIHAWGEHEGHPFYTMDFVSGEPLSRLLQSGPLPIDRTVRYLVGIARAVAAAHTQAIVHRDLKPSNIMIDASDQPRILDFGLAKRRRAIPEAELPSTGPLSPSDSHPGQGPKTQRGAILGTPAYMSPEQARGEHQHVSPATDVHALGVICYEMLTGKPPFHAETTMETLMQVAERTPAPPRQGNARVPVALESICMCCLAKAPGERYPDASVLADELERHWRGATHSQRFAQLALAAGALVLVLHLLQLLSPGPSADGRSWLLHLATRVSASSSPAVQEVAQLLAVLTSMFVFYLLPALAWLALVVWLSAWIWYSGRGLLEGTLLAVFAAVMWLVWPLLGGALVVPAMLSAAAFTALLVPVLRWWKAEERLRGERTAARSDPYLQRLFAVRGEHAPKAVLRAHRAAVKHADVEPGKTLMHGKQCLLRWGRQQSLDRAVLIWLDTTSTQSGLVTPGVLVRHPHVLTLHAVGPCPEGRFLVTEPVAATPLAELLERRPLTVNEAISITISVARALQAFHDQGACHGRLCPEWILLRGESEPLLCPCGVPSDAENDRQTDIQAVARLLLDWLPPRGTRWQHSSRAVLYRVCDAALRGEYARVADLADDLENAAQIADARRHEQWTNRIAGTLYLLAVLGLLGFLLAEPLGLFAETHTTFPFLPHYLLAFLPGITLFGYSHARAVVHRLRHPLHIAARSRWLGQRTGNALAILTGLAVLPTVLAAFASSAEPRTLSTLVLGPLVLIGFCGLGILFAGVRFFGEVLFGSLQYLRADRVGQDSDPDNPVSGSEP